MRFETPWAFLILLVIPVLWYLHRRRTMRAATLRFSSTASVVLAGSTLRQHLVVVVPFLLEALAVAMLAVALARPQQGIEEVRDVNKGIAIEMVVDRSGSMGAEMDADGQKMTRLDVVKRVFKDFVNGNDEDLEGRPSDLIGLVAFARYADTVCPLTLAHDAVDQLLDTVHLATRKEENLTAVGDAIALASARLETAEQEMRKQYQSDDDYEIKSKIIILLTDGQNNTGKRTPLQAAQIAKDWGIKIYCIGVGGGVQTIQTPFGPQQVRSPLDAATLDRIAKMTGGVFYVADDEKSLEAIYEEIDKLEKSEVETITYKDYKELFAPFAIAALALLMVEVLLSSTVLRRIP